MSAETMSAAEAHHQQTVLSVKDLQTHFSSERGLIRSVNGISLEVRRGEIVGLVGESGSGKSVTGFSIMGLVEPPGKIVGGEILYHGQDLRSATPEALRQIRGNRIAMIFQDPMMTLNPVLRIDTQMIETVQAHRTISEADARALALDKLKMVGIPAPEARLKTYPHEMSGGMRQRVAIAIALLHEPDLIIADEPTTALDVTIQSQILFQIRKLCRETGTSLIWISHDLSVVRRLADRVMVMYAGKIVEDGTAQNLITSPRHPYTVGLIRSIPSHNKPGQRLYQIPGFAPSPNDLPTGCAFAPRCERVTASCTAQPPSHFESDGRRLACFNPFPVEAS